VASAVLTKLQPFLDRIETKLQVQMHYNYVHLLCLDYTVTVLIGRHAGS